jgi:hypothetical protein
MSDDDGCLRDSEVALMDTLKLIFEVIVAKGISKSETLSEALRRQAQVYPPETMPRAIWIVEQLRASIDAPRRKEARELLSRTPDGRA